LTQDERDIRADILAGLLADKGGETQISIKVIRLTVFTMLYRLGDSDFSAAYASRGAVVK
jgi:hypothetical protein